MLKALKIWWLEKQLRHQVEDLALARKYQRQEYLLMDRTIARMEIEKQKTFLHLNNLLEEDRKRAAATGYA